MGACWAPVGRTKRAKQAAQEEMAAVAALLKQELGLELSATKTLVTPVTQPFAFLGHHICVRDSRGYKRTVCVTVIPKERRGGYANGSSDCVGAIAPVTACAICSVT